MKYHFIWGLNAPKVTVFNPPKVTKVTGLNPPKVTPKVKHCKTVIFLVLIKTDWSFCRRKLQCLVTVNQ